MKYELVKKDDVPNVLEELNRAYYDIPFGNSAFQTEKFIINASLTPERAYRAIGLKLFDRINALKEAEYQKRKSEIDIQEYEAKIQDHSTSRFDKQRAQLEINRILNSQAHAEKLINDALVEVSQLYAAFKKLPKYSRESFEAGEHNHFKLKLERQMKGLVGAPDSLLAMGEKVGDMKPIDILDGVLKLESQR